MDIRLALMCGTDIPVPECQLIIHQPKIKEIALIGEKDFFVGYQTLLVNKNMLEQGENVPANISNFQIFMTIMKEKEAFIRPGSPKAAPGIPNRAREPADCRSD